VEVIGGPRQERGGERRGGRDQQTGPHGANR
jgi:hypothetical protein